MKHVLFVLGGGIGNIVQATPAIKVAADSGWTVDLCLHCNSSTDVKGIFRLPCVRNVYVNEDPNQIYAYQLNGPFTPGKLHRAKKAFRTRINYAQHIEEAKVYYDLCEQIGISRPMGNAEINVGPTVDYDVPKDAVAIYCGSKHNWAMKRWNKYDQLAEKFDNVIVVGSKLDIESHGNPSWIKKPWNWPKHVKFFTGSLQNAANVISRCKKFIGNDGGLAHVAAATGIPTFVLFGPSSHIKNKPYATNSHAIFIDIPCLPCQFKKDANGDSIFGDNKADCPYSLRCMKEMSVEFVLDKVREYA